MHIKISMFDEPLENLIKILFCLDCEVTAEKVLDYCDDADEVIARIDTLLDNIRLRADKECYGKIRI